MEEPKRIILRGQIWTALLKTAYEGSSIQIGERPIIIVSNNVNNEHCNNLDYLAITSQDKKKLPTHVLLDENCGLFKSSIAMAEQGNKIPKSELRKYIGMVDNETIIKINRAIKVQQGLDKPFNISKAYNYLDSISELTKFVRKLKEYKIINSEELLSLKITKKEFIAYCAEYDIDYKIIVRQYNEKHRKQRLEQTCQRVVNG